MIHTPAIPAIPAKPMDSGGGLPAADIRMPTRCNRQRSIEGNGR